MQEEKIIEQKNLRNHYVPVYFLSGWITPNSKSGNIATRKVIKNSNPRGPEKIVHTKVAGCIRVGFEKGLYPDYIERPVSSDFDKRMSIFIKRYREEIVNFTDEDYKILTVFNKSQCLRHPSSYPIYESYVKKYSHLTNLGFLKKIVSKEEPMIFDGFDVISSSYLSSPYGYRVDTFDIDEGMGCEYVTGDSVSFIMRSGILSSVFVPISPKRMIGFGCYNEKFIRLFKNNPVDAVRYSNKMIIKNSSHSIFTTLNFSEDSIILNNFAKTKIYPTITALDHLKERIKLYHEGNELMKNTNHIKDPILFHLAVENFYKDR